MCVNVLFIETAVAVPYYHVLFVETAVAAFEQCANSADRHRKALNKILESLDTALTEGLQEVDNAYEFITKK